MFNSKRTIGLVGTLFISLTSAAHGQGCKGSLAAQVDCYNQSKAAEDDISEKIERLFQTYANTEKLAKEGLDNVKEARTLVANFDCVETRTAIFIVDRENERRKKRGQPVVEGVKVELLKEYEKKKCKELLGG